MTIYTEINRIVRMTKMLRTIPAVIVAVLLVFAMDGTNGTSFDKDRTQSPSENSRGCSTDETSARVSQITHSAIGRQIQTPVRFSAQSFKGSFFSTRLINNRISLAPGISKSLSSSTVLRI